MDERCDNYSLTSSQSFNDEEIIEALKRLAQQWQEISERSRAAANGGMMSDWKGETYVDFN